MIRIWKVATSPLHPEDRNEENLEKYREFSKKNKFVGIGWKILKDLTSLSEKEIKKEYRKVYIDGKDKSKEINLFVNEIKKGDIILHYGSSEPYNIFNVGEVTKSYYYTDKLESELLDIGAYVRHRIDVKWWEDSNGKKQDFKVKEKNNLISLRDTVKNLTNSDLDFIENEELKRFILKKIKERSDEAIVKVEKNINGDQSKKKIPKNLILYGPPGTGKTFITKQKAIDIIENKSNIPNINEEFPPLSIEEAKKIIEYLKNRKKEETLEFLKMLIKGRVYRDEVIKKFNCSGNHVDLGILGNYTNAINKVRNITAPESRIYDWDDKNKFWTLDETTKDNLKKALKEVEDGSS